jgi:5-methylcytosine-specific restriction endonuclease McrA
MKTCWKCRSEKALDAFGVDVRRHDGKNPKCKACVAADSAEYRERNKEKRKATLAAYRERNPDKIREAYAKWKASDRAPEVRAAWVKKNPEKVRSTKAKWRSWNRPQIAAIKASRTSADGAHTGEDIKRLMRLQRSRCAHCRENIACRYHADHIVPLKLGGTNDANNIQLLCPTCNLKKGAKHPIAFAQQSGRLL